MRYQKFRAEATKDSSSITLTTGGSWDNKPTTTKVVNTDEETRMSLIIAGGVEANDTFSWKVYAYKDVWGPAEMVADGTGVIGTQRVYYFPDGVAETAVRYWADSLVLSNESFARSVDIIDTGNNRVCKLSIKTAGYKYWLMEITNADGTGTEATNLSVWYSLFKGTS